MVLHSNELALMIYKLMERQWWINSLIADQYWILQIHQLPLLHLPTQWGKCHHSMNSSAVFFHCSSVGWPISVGASTSHRQLHTSLIMLPMVVWPTRKYLATSFWLMPLARYLWSTGHKMISKMCQECQKIYLGNLTFLYCSGECILPFSNANLAKWIQAKIHELW